MPSRPDSGRLDALIVPSIRSPKHLRFATGLAAELGLPCLILSSVAWKPQVARNLLGRREGAIVQMADGVRDAFFGLGIRRHAVIPESPHADTAAKRNVGLRVARTMGWRTVLFLDDDIETSPLSDLRPDSVAHVVATLRSSSLRAIGWRATEFPDNSVVCLLRRTVNLPQEVFVGGQALVVDLAGELPFFPPVYNEDWLFMHDWVVDTWVAEAGEVRQERFDPFLVQRARQQEFGDVLAEGLYELIHVRTDVREAMSAAFWVQFMRSRRDVLVEIRDRLLQGESYRDDPAYLRWSACIEASLDELRAIEPERLAAFVTAWRADLKPWNDQLEALAAKPLYSLGAALEREGLTGGYVND